MFFDCFKAVCRFVLYPAAFLALFGVGWRTQPFFSVTQIALLLFGSATAVFLFVIERKHYQEKNQRNRKTNSVSLPHTNHSNAEQQIIRFRTNNGTDRLEGTFLVEFQEEQRTSSVHIPFCPAFETMPNVEVFVLDDDDAKTTIVQLQPFGIRIDVKKGQKTERLHLTVIAEQRAEV